MMYIDEKGRPVYTCDFCRSPMEEGRSLNQWCLTCEAWWEVNMPPTTKVNGPEVLHNHVRVIGKPRASPKREGKKPHADDLQIIKELVILDGEDEKDGKAVTIKISL